MIVSMKRLTLVGIRQEEGDILRALQKIGAVELISVTADDDGGEGARRLDEAAERISRFSESLSAIKPYAKKPGFLAPAREEKLEKMQQDVGEAEAASEHIRAILEEAGLQKTDVIKTVVYLKNMSDFAAVNAIYADFFGDHKPARSCVEVAGLPKGGLVEIEVVAAK